MEDPLKSQEGGDHYKALKIQPAEFCHANGIPFLEGNVIKYVTRHRSKGGVQDLRKAIHFLQILLKLEYAEGAIDADARPEAVIQMLLSARDQGKTLQCISDNGIWCTVSFLHEPWIREHYKRLRVAP